MQNIARFNSLTSFGSSKVRTTVRPYNNINIVISRILYVSLLKINLYSDAKVKKSTKIRLSCNSPVILNYKKNSNTRRRRLEERTLDSGEKGNVEGLVLRLWRG